MAQAAKTRIRIGVGGWTFEPWRGAFYPQGLAQKRELEHASRALTSIEINGTYYGSQKPASFIKWREETPEDFVFAVKGPRFTTNRRSLAEAGDSIERFFTSGVMELKDKLGPVNWQFMATKKFDPADFAAFLELLPKEKDGVRLRHAIEVRSPTFATQQFYDLAAKHKVAVVYAKDEEFPEIDQPTADFTYARLMATDEKLVGGVSPAELTRLAKQAKGWAQRGDVFAYFISGAKVRNPAAAQALAKKIG
jgi:uncharacterized protein YecE (DUF72 family)